MSRIFKKSLTNLIVLALSTLLALAIFEIALRSLDLPKTSAWGWKWAGSPYKSTGNIPDTRTNQLGLRGRPISYQPDDLVIILVGDSFVEAGTHAFEDMPEQVLETALQDLMADRRVRVFSIASAGWGQDQELLALQDYLKNFRANVVINWLTPVNDFWENTFIERSVTAAPGPLKPTFYLDASGSLKGPVISEERWRVEQLLTTALARWKADTGESPGAKISSRWLQRLPPADLQPVRPSDCPTTEVAQNDLVDARRQGNSRVTVLSSETVGMARSHFSPFSLSHSAREKYQIQLTRSLMTRMAQITRAKGGEFLAFYPYGTDMDKALQIAVCVKESASGLTYALDTQDLLAPLKNPDLGIEFVTPTLNTSEPTSLTSADWHMNRHANQMALAALARELASRARPLSH